MKLNFDNLSSKDPKIRYGCTKELLNIGKDKPAILYNYFDRFEKMLKSENNIFKWTAIDLIGYLSSVDNENKTDKKIPDLIKLLHCGQLITCNHAIFAIGLIAQNKPKHRKRIIKELLTISKDRFETDECKNIAIGKVVETLNRFSDEINNEKLLIDFVAEATNNSRNATKKKAERLMKKISKSI
jgi:hypothetical protein